MNEQPEALRLADALDIQVLAGGGDLQELEDAATELRQLHEVNQELLEALKVLLREFDSQFHPYEDQECQINAREAINKAIGEGK